MNIEIENVMKKWLTLRGCANYLGITERAVYCLVHRGQLTAYRNGRRLYFLVQELDQRILGKTVPEDSSTWVLK